MPVDTLEPWKPTRIRRVINVIRGTSTQPIVVKTDVGDAYVKTMANPVGPDALTCDLIGTRLAQWLGVPTLEPAVLVFPEELVGACEGVPVQAGPAFATRAIELDTVAHGESTLDISNPEATSGVVVLDTWLRNIDRYAPHRAPPRANYGNLAISPSSKSGKKHRLLAIDHGEIIRVGVALDERCSRIDAVRDEQVYGFFPCFRGHVRALDVSRFCQKLGSFTTADARQVLHEVPHAWLGKDSVRQAVVDFLTDRAKWLAPRIEASIQSAEAILPLPGA